MFRAKPPPLEDKNPSPLQPLLVLLLGSVTSYPFPPPTTAEFGKLFHLFESIHIEASVISDFDGETKSCKAPPLNIPVRIGAL